MLVVRGGQRQKVGRAIDVTLFIVDYVPAKKKPVKHTVPSSIQVSRKHCHSIKRHSSQAKVLKEGMEDSQKQVCQT